jgi:outer membrane protein OmpA-like peptidoglycan-associated protein
MEESNSADHLSTSLTDLMTSLMVIFILLLLVFLHRTAGKDAVVADVLLKRLRHDLNPQGFDEKTIKPDPHDRNAIWVIVPDRLMNFEIGKSTLRPEGEQFLRQYIPRFADVLCSKEFQSSIESIVVEGHTDMHPYVGRSAEDSQNMNLKLSQDRSMEVVKNALADLSGLETNRKCFLEKLSASGRGQQEQEATPEESRRVILKVRVKVVDVDSAKEAVH